ncbi:MAG: OmpA family protein, partial [Cyclobacteriaceae bacterium]
MMCIPNLYQKPRTWLVILLILAGVGDLAAQNKKKFKRGQQVQLQDSLTHFSQSDIFTFPNLSRISYYQDVRQFDRIAAALELNEQAELYRLLRTYVKNFGVQNFSRNVSMIWILARLSETYGPPGEAVLLYKLAVKHHQQGVDITSLNSSLNLESLAKRYDSLERDKKKYFVPLDHYYQLVDYRKEIDTLRPPHAVLTLMSRDINSDKEDYGPVMGNIDYLMLFTSKRNRHTVGFTDTFDEDIFF